MSSTVLVTEADLARARADPAFRHRLVSESLELLLGRLNAMRSRETDAKSAREIREGVQLAVELADLLQRIAPGNDTPKRTHARGDAAP